MSFRDLLAGHPGEPVYLVADKANALRIVVEDGLAASFREALAERTALARRDVRIITDVSGRERAHVVASELRGLVASVEVRESPRRKTITEHLDGGDTWEELVTDPDVPRAVLQRLSDVEPEILEWLWPGRVPLGKLTVIDGDPGLGKSMITIDLAARVSSGAAMPDGTRGDIGGPGGVVLMGAEDDLGDTIRPRLDAAKADVSRIVALQGVIIEDRERSVSLSDLKPIEQAIAKVDARLVIIDPVMAYLGGDAHRDQDVRQSLAPLAALASRAKAAFVIVRHLNKGGGQNATYRGGGSIGIIGAARLGLLVAKDPDDQTGARRILAVSKSNLAEPATALAYHLEPAGAVARVAWEGTTAHTARTLLAECVDDETRGAVDEAKDFLRGALHEGPRPTKELQTEARSAGISDITLRRARTALNVAAAKCGRPGGAGQRWEWSLPDGAEDAHQGPKMLTQKDEQLRREMSTFAGPATCPGCGCKAFVDPGACEKCGYRRVAS